MKKIQPKLQILSPQEEAASLEASFNSLKKMEKTASERPAVRRGRPKKRTAQASAIREGKTRLTIDLPTDIYEIVTKHKEDTGQNFTHLIVSLLRKHFNAPKL